MEQTYYSRAVYMDGGTGRLPGRDVCRDGTFAGTGRFSSWVYMRMFLATWDDFTRDNLQSQHNMSVYMIKIVPL